MSGMGKCMREPATKDLWLGLLVGFVLGSGFVVAVAAILALTPPH